MRILLKLFICILISTSVSVETNAQKGQGKPVTKTQPFKAPKLYTYLSNYKDSVSIPLSVAESIVAARLSVSDDKKTVYTITSYQFLYRKKTVSETEDGKPMPATSMVSERFTTSPLPALWVDKIREGLKSGEELFFFDIIVKDAQGRPIYAPNVKIIVQ